jgi:hypothetical protein
MAFKSNTADAQWAARVKKLWTERADKMWRRDDAPGRAQGAFATEDECFASESKIRAPSPTALQLIAKPYCN